MVLVGKVNKDIVLRLGRHGQPAVGLCGDDGLLFRVATMEGPGGEDIGYVGRIDRVDVDVVRHVAEDYIPVIASVGADRDGRSHNVNADDAAAAVARALGAHKVIFLTDVRGWLRDPSDPASVISATTADEVLAALPTLSGGMRPKLQACVDAIHGGVGARTSSTAASRTPCCSSSSRTPASAPRCARRGDERAHQQLRPLSRRVRARGGRPAVGRRRGGVSRLPRRHLRLQRRALPSARGRRRAGAGGAAHARLQPLLQRADGRARRAARVRARWAAACTSPTRAPRRTRRRSSSSARRAAAGTSSSLHHGFHGRTYGALSATPQESKQAPFAPLVPGFRAVDADPEAIAAAVDEGTAAVLLEPIQGESGVHILAGRGAARGPGGVRPRGRGARLRRGPDRHGPHGHAVGLRAQRRGAGRHDRGQGARRRAADRRADHRRAAGRGARAGRPRLHLRRRAGRVGRRPRRTRRDRRPGAARARTRARRAPGGGPARAARRRARARARAHGGRRPRRPRARGGAPRPAGAAPRGQRHGPARRCAACRP